MAATIIAVAAPRARAASTHRYAFVGGTAVAASGHCTAPGPAPSQQCSLTEVLANAQNGDTVYLGTPTSGGPYVGNWTVNASLTIRPAPGIPTAALDGNHGSSAAPCTTAGFDGPVLTVVAGVEVNVDDLIIQNANDSVGLPDGGGLKNVGGTVALANLTFNNDSAGSQGGAIYNASDGIVTVSDSTFTGDQAGEGGAIANVLPGTVTVTDSAFSGNQAGFTGGAIDNAHDSFSAGIGQVTVTGVDLRRQQSRVRRCHRQRLRVGRRRRAGEHLRLDLHRQHRDCRRRCHRQRRWDRGRVRDRHRDGVDICRQLGDRPRRRDR